MARNKDKEQKSSGRIPTLDPSSSSVNQYRVREGISMLHPHVRAYDSFMDSMNGHYLVGKKQIVIGLLFCGLDIALMLATTPVLQALHLNPLNVYTRIGEGGLALVASGLVARGIWHLTTGMHKDGETLAHLGETTRIVYRTITRRRNTA